MGKVLKFKGVEVEYDDDLTSQPKPLTPEESKACDIAKSIRQTFTDEQVREIEASLLAEDENNEG